MINKKDACQALIEGKIIIAAIMVTINTPI